MSTHNDYDYLQQLLSVLNNNRLQERVEERIENIENQSGIFSNAISSLVMNGIRSYISYNYGIQRSSSFLETFISYYINENNHNNENNNENNQNNMNNEANNDEYKGNVFNMEDLEPGEYKDCSICFEEFTKDSQIIITPCNHVYHLNCINQWYHRSHTCPVCRGEI